MGNWFLESIEKHGLVPAILGWLVHHLYWRPRAWLRRRDFHIDPEAGNDANDARTPETAIKTCAEFGRRVNRRGLIEGDLRVYIYADVPASDPLELVFTKQRGVKVLLRGIPPRDLEHEFEAEEPV